MIPGWPAGEVGLGCALLVDSACTIRDAQGAPLDGDQFCELLQDIAELVSAYVHRADEQKPHILIAHVGG